ncbi:Carboxylesterase [Handroanthus impetiginosus]|uniref:Carboxylesterase n=1 Tax=Handroanthus impetiginosus TaxID=429701 RepID=A0A2G9GHN4_9LAMI|nr:Carboxylesterase [Handroanthus impetiginosus]
MSKSNSLTTIDLHHDPYGYVAIIQDFNGVVGVGEILPKSPAYSDPCSPLRVPSIIPINKAYNTWARIFLSRLPEYSISATKLPLIVHFHGGGSVLGSAATSKDHQFCCEVTLMVPGWSSPLTTAFLGATTFPPPMTIIWKHCTGSKPPQTNGVLSWALIGGGNVAYGGGLRALNCVEDLKPIEIRGLILQQLFFGRVQMTLTERRLIYDKGPHHG